MIETRLADKIIAGFNFKDEAGNPAQWGHGHRQILDIILNRRAPDGRQRIHCMAHTRYGKSFSIGAGVSIRAATKPEKWAIVAGTKEKARIIMDYVINFVLDDPILRSQLDIEISLDRLRRERSQDRLQFARRGEIRVYSADSKNRQQLGNALMGFGAPNIIEDEAGLIDDDIQSKIMRMLGDSTDNFLMKIGNPFYRNHFLQSFNSDRYYKINIDWRQGLAEGRITQDFIDEMREQPNFEIFYENQFPAADAIDSKGWVPLLTDEDIERAMVDEIAPFGQNRLGGDVAGGGRNYSTMVHRAENVAALVYKKNEPNTMQYVSDFIVMAADKNVREGDSYVDKVGIGRGAADLLAQKIATKGVNGADKPDDEERFVNKRAEMFWRTREWILRGGKLLRHPDWMQLAKMKYRTILEGKNGKIQMISKEELLRNGVESPDVADAISETFYEPELLVGAGSMIQPQPDEAFDAFTGLPNL